MIPFSVRNYLDQNHARFSLLTHATAYTAQEEAAAAHVPGHEWAKTVVCVADGEPILAVLPAPLAVDLQRLQRASGARSLRLASESELPRWYGDCEVGAIPPFGPLFGQRVYVDQRLTDDPEVTCSGGSHHDALRMAYSEFERLAQPTITDVSLPPPRPVLPREAPLMDPVCGAIVEESAAAGRSHHLDETYYFCSQVCKMEFDDNPYAYVPKNDSMHNL